jgi:ABC-type polysaccharide transport system permease subunit
MGVEDKLFTKRKGGLSVYIKRFVKHYYIMLIPALLWLFFFSIVPMFGIVMAFQDYNPGKGILHSESIIATRPFLASLSSSTINTFICLSHLIFFQCNLCVLPLLFCQIPDREEDCNPCPDSFSAVYKQTCLSIIK